MSIEKIKKIIKMIEENDFSIEGNVLNEDIKGSFDDLKTIFATKDNEKSAKTISLGHSSTEKTNDMYNQWLSGATRVSSDGKDSLDIPSKDTNVVYAIYSEMNNKGIMPNDLEDKTFKTKYGYLKNKNGDSLILQRDGLITLVYNDNKLTKLKGIIFNISNKLSKTKVNDFYNELKNNKSKFKIKDITYNNNVIEIKF